MSRGGGTHQYNSCHGDVPLSIRNNHRTKRQQNVPQPPIHPHQRTRPPTPTIQPIHDCVRIHKNARSLTDDDAIETLLLELDDTHWDAIDYHHDYGHDDYEHAGC